MTEHDASPEFGRLLSAWLTAEAPDREPDDLLDRVLDRTVATRPRPRWWGADHPLAALGRPRIAARRAVLALALVGLLALTIVYVLAAASQPQLPRPLGRPGLLIGARDGEIQLIRTDGEIVARASTGGMFGGGAWSPDGTRIAHADGQPTDPFLVITDASLKELFRIHLPLGAEAWFSWSPDGRRVAFDTWTEATADIDVVDVDAGAIPAAITDPTLRGIAPSWSPDGSWIAFRGGGPGIDEEALYVVHPDGTGVRRVSNHGRAVNPYCGFPWTPDARSIGFETGYNGVWVVNVDGTKERVVLGGSEQAFCPSISPDGTAMAVMDDNGAGKNLAVVALAVASEGPSRTVPKAPLFDGPRALWSPDGSTLVINSRDKYSHEAPFAIVDPTGNRDARTVSHDPGVIIVDWQRLAP